MPAGFRSALGLAVAAMAISLPTAGAAAARSGGGQSSSSVRPTTVAREGVVEADLGDVRSITRIEVQRAPAAAGRLTVATSLGGRRFAVVARVRGRARDHAVTIRPLSARWLRVDFERPLAARALARVRFRVSGSIAPRRPRAGARAPSSGGARTPRSGSAPAGTAQPAGARTAPGPGAGPPPGAVVPAARFAGVVERPIDPRQQTALGFGERSHWLQPWRAYLDTPPASRLRSALGINFDVSAEDAEPVARLLAASGFTRARVEIGWGEFAYHGPAALKHPALHVARLAALRRHGIRPLILLNAHHGAPCPLRSLSVQLRKPAPAGTRVVELDAASAASVVPGRTGLNAIGSYKAAELLFTSVDGTGRAVLSKPLPEDLPAGVHQASTLKYAPFSPPLRANGTPNPIFEETMRGWLDYVHAVTDAVREVLGSTEFDLEVWNEYSFGSDFLDIGNYYEPAPLGGRLDDQVILARTIAWVRDPAHRLSGVRIGSGFSSERPWDAGSTAPAGLDALDKHPYPQNPRFPGQRYPGRALDADGQPSGWADASGSWHDAFTPAYDGYFPEYSLSGIQTETLVRDLSPITTSIYGTEHGRFTAPQGGQPPAVWITELNLDSSWPQRTGVSMSSRDIEHLRAKSALRALTAYVNKGARQLHFYAAGNGSWSLIGQEFWSALRADGTYPGDESGGATMMALRRLARATASAGRITFPRSLSLDAIGDYAGNRQFEGDGSPAHRALHNRDVLAFLPFQAADDRFVVPVYVMTRNLAKVYRPTAGPGEPSRFALPPERYRLTVGGVRADTAKVSALDALTGASVPVEVVARSQGKLVVELDVTDSPRLLSFDEA